MPEPRRAGRRYFAVDPVTLAQKLLGATIARQLDTGETLRARIVETEAYCGVEDKAAHSRGWRRTPRTEPMFGRPGTAYVFLVYGMHHCFNVVCGAVDEPVAVLVRAAEPIDGLETMRKLRKRGGPRPEPERTICSGPGRLCAAMAIDRAFTGTDLAHQEAIWIEPRPEPVAPEQIAVSPRIGIDYAGDWVDKPLRWYVRSSQAVSRAPKPRASVGSAKP